MGRSNSVSLIQFVLSGGIPPLIRAKAKNRRRQEKIDADPKLKAKRAAQRAAQRKNNPESHEREKAYWRERRAKQTPEERKAEYQRRKEIIASLSPEEYERRKNLATENMRRYRAKKKEAKERAHEQS